MKKFAIVFLAIACMLQACKKSSSASIVGTWQISDISGTYSNQSYPSAPVNNIIYSYASPILTEQDTVKTLVTVNEELWTFKSDGTFVINENFESNSATTPTIHVLNGWWDYTGSTIPNSTIVLRGSGSPGITPTGGSFFIKSVTGSQLVLVVNESTSSSTGSSTMIDITLTFTRQQ